MISPLQKEIITLLTEHVQNCKSKKDYEDLSCLLREKFLAAWSETPDNIETSEYISVGEVENKFTKRKEAGLTLKGHNEFVSTILWQAFGNSKAPKEVKDAYPSLTDEEWNQMLRICHFTLSLFEVDKE